MSVENEKIINNLEEKLEGKMPVTKEDLIHLVNSWGRLGDVNIAIEGSFFAYKKCEPKECYDLSKLNTSKITNMASLFSKSLFNGDISQWDTSKVTNMSSMFEGAKNFNSSLYWDASNVTSMDFMFAYAEKFNSPISLTTSELLVDTTGMFQGATNFNQPLKSFNTSNVTNMYGMFQEATKFDQEINFDTSKVLNMGSFLFCANAFSKPINFNVSNTTNLNYMLEDTTAFIKKYNNGKEFPKSTFDIKNWLDNNRERMNEIYKNSIKNKLDNNKNEFEQLIKEKNIPIDSKLYKELFKVYNDTQDKLKQDLEELKSKVVDIATKDFTDRNL